MSDDDLDIPDFLRVTPADAAARKLAWERNPPKPMPMFAGHQPTETEKAYRASIERDRLARIERDRPRFAAMRAKAAAEKAELDAVKAAAAKTKWRKPR